MTERTRGTSVSCRRAFGLIGTSALHCVHRAADSMASSAPELDIDSTMAGLTESRGGEFENRSILSRGWPPFVKKCRAGTISTFELDMGSTMAGPIESRGGEFENKSI